MYVWNCYINTQLNKRSMVITCPSIFTNQDNDKFDIRDLDLWSYAFILSCHNKIFSSQEIQNLTSVTSNFDPVTCTFGHVISCLILSWCVITKYLPVKRHKIWPVNGWPWPLVTRFPSLPMQSFIGTCLKIMAVQQWPPKKS